MKFRKKPVVIEAVQWNGDTAAMFAFAGDKACPGDWVNPDNPADRKINELLGIQTIEGTMTANRGDWIIKGVKGEFYPCKPDIFETSYDPVVTGSDGKEYGIHDANIPG
jgi:hypothetical protein